MAPIKDKKVLQALMANLQAGVERGEGDELKAFHYCTFPIIYLIRAIACARERLRAAFFSVNSFERTSKEGINGGKQKIWQKDQFEGPLE